MRTIALYLPQYYPTEINDKWYGKGFTEWTNVAAGRPLFPGHYQPHIPADLGFYDLRLKESRRAQALLAEKYGIDAFCYWTYWFGGGKTALEMPIWEMHKDNEITLPFCMAWANHSWEKKQWDKKGSNELIYQQQYLGNNDYTDFFYKMLPLFQDKRYFKVHGKLFFIVYLPLDAPEAIMEFISCWRQLAEKEKLDGFYFVGKDAASRNKDRILKLGFDAIYNDDVFNIHHNLSPFQKIILKIRRKYFHHPTVFKYKDAIKYMIMDYDRDPDVIPVVAPNWDHSPRSGANAILLDDCEPKYFEEVLQRAKEILDKRDEEEQIVLIKAWNEWGEGNHLEPDRKYGLGYLEALQKVKNEG